MSRRYGAQQECACCRLDIEWHGRKIGWIDRGGNGWCDTGGGSAGHDGDGIALPVPHKKHAPEVPRLYWPTVRNDRTGEDTRMTTRPFPHREACAILSKLIPDGERKGARSLLVEHTD